MIIAISGTPGTGKTEVAKVLAKQLGWKMIELNGLADEKGLHSGYDKSRKCKIVDVGGIKKEVARISRSGKNIIIESHYAHDVKNDFTVILRANPGQLRERLVSRGWTLRKIEENIQSEIMEVCKSEAMNQGRNVVEIDTTGKTPVQVSEEIRKAISRS